MSSRILVVILIVAAAFIGSNFIPGLFGKGSVPKGTILPWFSKDPDPPKGWAFCDADTSIYIGNSELKGLNNKFLRATNDTSRVGIVDGDNGHDHGGAVLKPGGQEQDTKIKSGGRSNTTNHTHPINPDQNVPVHLNVRFIIKL